MFEMIPRGQALFDLDLSLKAPGTGNFFLLRTWHRHQPPLPSLCTFLPGSVWLTGTCLPSLPWVTAEHCDSHRPLSTENCSWGLFTEILEARQGGEEVEPPTLQKSIA